MMRVALAGSSGTGKSTLAEFIASQYAIPLNPIGSRSVAEAMGYDSPYDVDKEPGARAAFQRRLIAEKMAWEAGHESFVTDRTTMDNLAYTALHDVSAIDAEALDISARGLARYTHIIYCPVSVFCNPGDDPARKADLTYHRIYDTLLDALLKRYAPVLTPVALMVSADKQWRRDHVLRFLGPRG